jgi:hypothetical protein
MRPLPSEITAKRAEKALNDENYQTAVRLVHLASLQAASEGLPSGNLLDTIKSKIKAIAERFGQSDTPTST